MPNSTIDTTYRQLERPAARRHTEVSEPIAGQRTFMGELVQRADDSRIH